MADFSFSGLNGAVAAGLTTKIQSEEISFDGASLDNVVLNIDGVYGTIGSAVTFISDQGSSRTDFNLSNVVREEVDFIPTLVFNGNTSSGIETSSTSIVEEGLVLYLESTNSSSYGGAGNTWTDISGRGNDATLIGNYSFANSQMIFTDNGYARIPIDPDFDLIGDFAFETIVYMTGTPDSTYPSGLISCWSELDDGNRNNFLLAVNSSRQVFVQMNNNSLLVTHPTPLDLNRWHHIVFTRRGSTVELYIDSVKHSLETTSYSDNVLMRRDHLEIGRYSASSGQSFEGSIPVVRIYTGRGLSSQEIYENSRTIPYYPNKRLNLTDGKFTIETLLYWSGDSPADSAGIILAQDPSDGTSPMNYRFRIRDTGNRVQFHYQTTSSRSSIQSLHSGTVELVANLWNHIAVTYDTVTLRMYINGVLVSSAVRTLYTTEGVSTTIGDSTDNDEHLYGKVSYIRAYKDRCFNDYEVFSNANKLYVRDSVESEGTVSVGVATYLGVTGAIPGYLTGRRPLTGLVFPRGVYNK
jgi:hypothetical protein